MNRLKTNKSGASMVLTVVLMMVFVLVGSALLPAAYSSSAGIVSREQELQCYYYARALLDTLDDSLKGGSLEALIFDEAFSQLGSADEKTLDFHLSPTLSLTLPGVTNGPVYKNADIHVKGSLQVIARDNGGRAAQCYFHIESCKIYFVTEYFKVQYALSASYGFSGFGRYESSVWRWNGQWENSDVSQK